MGEVQLKILLVDDVAFNRQVASARLRALGHDVDVVESGEAAIEAVQTEVYDLVLMDIQMPGKDGIAATREIRRLGSKFASLPIIAMTADDQPDRIAACRDAGMDGSLSKPFNDRQLARMLERLDSPAKSPVAKTDDVFEPKVYAETAELFDRREMLAHFDRLNRQIEAMLVDGDSDTDLQRRAHQLVSTAGFLGFTRLSGLCHELETASLRGNDVRSVHEAVRRAGREALCKIRELRQAV